MSIRSKLKSRAVHTGLLLLLAAGLLWLFFRGSDLSAIRSSLAGANPWILGSALGVILATYLLRAARWQLLLAPFGRAGLWNCFTMTVIGFMLNFLAVRLGEIARPYLLARREGFSASSAFATILLERVLDLVTVVLLIGFWLLVSPPEVASGSALRSLELGGALGLAASVIGLGILFVLARYPEQILPWIKKIFRVLPAKLEMAASGFTETFAAGLAVLVDGRRLFLAAAMSILLWMNIAFAFWLGARALGVEFPYGDTFLVIGFLTVGVAVPTPGAVGGYHVMAELALTTLFGTEASLAKAVALLNHAIAFLPVTFLGVLFFARADLSFREVEKITSSSEELEES